MAEIAGTPVFPGPASSRRKRAVPMMDIPEGARVPLTLVLASLLACAGGDPAPVDFAIDAQPAGPALNAFAQQADVTLLFSYDAVSGLRVQPLRGAYTVDAGLSRLLRGTGLSYRRSEGGDYLVCTPAACAGAARADMAAAPQSPGQ